jgi:hypothetical protein
VEFRIAFIYHFRILAPKYPLHDAYRAMQNSTNNETSDGIGGAETFWHAYVMTLIVEKQRSQ